MNLNNEKQKLELYVEGMHCAACEILLEKKLSGHRDIDSIKASLKSNKITIEGSFTNKEKLAQELTEIVQEKGYRIHIEKPKAEINWNELIIALPIAVLIAFIFLFLQKSGILGILNTNNISYPVIFLIGIVASLSSCMAVVGGLVLSMSSTYAKESPKNRVQSQITFHISRIVSFLILGGLIGLIGSAFTLSSNSVFILSMIVGIVMLILGINLLNIFPWAKSLQLHMPKFLTKGVLENNNTKNIFTPLLLGTATFFLPCGFTQAMQIQALRSGSILTGALTMFVFSLGTLPVLALISFTSIELSQAKWSGVFFKVAGLLVLFFAVINILGALTVKGIIPPILNI